jgi:putative ABC transport system ATP-binding protein
MTVENPVIQVKGLTKVFLMGDIEVHALRGVSFEVKQGEVVAIMGPSGSGKSTLMNMVGCLDSPTGGDYYLDGELVSELRDDELATVRNHKIGFVFQKYNLLPRATALANVELPLRYAGENGNRKEKALKALEAVGLGDRIKHKPNELSGGEQQRVAIARAVVNEPSIILADEPTGNLDSKSGEEVMALLLSMNKIFGTTLVIVTHDAHIANQAGRIIHLLDGLIESEETAS